MKFPGSTWPSEPSYRRRLQTAISCYGPMIAVVNVMVKRHDFRSCQVWIREMSANEPLMRHRKHLNDIKTGTRSASWERHGRYLFTARVVSGVEEA